MNKRLPAAKPSLTVGLPIGDNPSLTVGLHVHHRASSPSASLTRFTA